MQNRHRYLRKIARVGRSRERLFPWLFALRWRLSRSPALESGKVHIKGIKPATHEGYQRRNPNKSHRRHESLNPIWLRQLRHTRMTAPFRCSVLRWQCHDRNVQVRRANEVLNCGARGCRSSMRCSGTKRPGFGHPGRVFRCTRDAVPLCRPSSIGTCRRRPRHRPG